MRGIPPLEDVVVLPVWAKLWWNRDDLVKGPGDEIDGRLADMAERKKWRGWSIGECNLSSGRCRCAACGGIGVGTSGQCCEKGAGLDQIHF